MLGPTANGPAGSPGAGRPDAPGPAQELTDLDAPPPAPAEPARRAATTGVAWPARTPPWLRSPLGLVAVLAATAVLSGLVVAGVRERAELAERQATVRLFATLTWPNRFVASPGHALDVRVMVLNAGPEPVEVTAARLEGSRSELRLEDPMLIGAGASATLPATLELDCPVSGSPGRLALTAVTGDGRSRDVTPMRLGWDMGMTPRDAATFCADPRLEEIPVWRTSVEDDGALLLHLRNVRGQDALLTVTSPPGTSVRGEPPLPVLLPAGRSELVRLHLDVQRCTSAARRADAGAQVTFALGDQTGIINPDLPTVVGWFARRVAQECG